MIIYLVVFFISILFTFLAEKSNNKKKFIFFSLVAILAPSILAGLRSENIGTDILYYAKPYYQKALKAPNLIYFLENNEIEIGYLLLTYGVTFFTKSLNALLFFIQLIITSCVYYFAYSYKNKNPMFITMSIFLLFFYNINLNIMRQSISVAIILCSLVFLEKKEYKKLIIAFVIALSFHNSSVFAIPIYCLFIIGYNNNISSKFKFILSCLLIVLAIFATLIFDEIVEFLAIELQIIPERYYNYLSSSFLNGKNYEFDWYILIFKMIWIFLCGLVAYKKGGNKENVNGGLYILLIIDAIVYTLSARIVNISRSTYYYCIPGILAYIPQVKKLFKNDKLNQIFIEFVIISAFLCYWYITYIHFNMNQTYPFIFYK